MRLKRKWLKLPAVTLLELVVVLAIFSGIAVGAMAMVRPAMKIYRKSVAQERAVSCADSIARYIQDNLRYADRLLVYENTGLTDIEQFIECPFEYGCVNVKLRNQVSRNCRNDKYEEVFISAGGYDDHAYINPISFFAQYYYTESILRDDSGYTTEQIKEYYKNKTIYIMEITPNGRVNNYGYPLEQTYTRVSTGDSGQFRGTNPDVKTILSSVNQDYYEGIDSVEISTPQFSASAADGMKCSITVRYKGVTKNSADSLTQLKYVYSAAVNFVNLIENETIYVPDKYNYTAQTYHYFDWSGKSFHWPAYGGTYTCNGGNTYIVYSMPEIIPV